MSVSLHRSPQNRDLRPFLSRPSSARLLVLRAQLPSSLFAAPGYISALGCLPSAQRSQLRDLLNIQRLNGTLDVCLASECPGKAAKTYMSLFCFWSHISTRVSAHISAFFSKSSISKVVQNQKCLSLPLSFQNMTLDEACSLFLLRSPGYILASGCLVLLKYWYSTTFSNI